MVCMDLEEAMILGGREYGFGKRQAFLYGHQCHTYQSLGIDRKEMAEKISGAGGSRGEGLGGKAVANSCGGGGEGRNLGDRTG